MEKFNYRLLLGTLLFFALLDFGLCIKCYHCFGFNSSDCNKDPFSGDKVPMLICQEDSVCAKIVIPSFLGYPSTIHRSCQSKHDCILAKGLSHECYECENELCNSSPRVFTPFLCVIAGLIIVKQYLL